MTIDGLSKEYPYNKEPIIIPIPNGKDYIISFSNVDGHLTPDPITGHVPIGATNHISVTYNACLLNITFNVTSASATLKYGNVSKTIQHNHKELIPYNTSVTITPNGIEGYYAPVASTIKCNDVSKSVVFTWNTIEYGIYLVDLDKNLYDIKSILPIDNIMGYAVIDNSRARILSIEGSPLYWGPQGQDFDVPGTSYTTYHNGDPSSYPNTYQGKSNTTAIINKLSGKTHTSYYGEIVEGAPAAEYCRAYSKGCKGAGEWYLPDTGEISMFMNNYSALYDSILSNGLYGYFFGDDNGYPYMYSMWSSAQLSTVNAGSSIKARGYQAFYHDQHSINTTLPTEYTFDYFGYGVTDKASDLYAFPMCDF